MSRVDDHPGGSATKILLLTDNLRIGGVQQVVVRLAGELLKRGFRVGIAASAEGDLWRSVPPGCSVHHLPPGRGVHAALKRLVALRKLIRNDGFEILHGHQRGITLTARVALVGLPAVLVEHVHNIFLPVSKKRVSFRGAYLIACGSAVETMLLNDYKRRAQNIYRILNGVPDLSKAYATERDPSINPTRIIAVGRTSEQKNPFKFIDVIESLTAQGCVVYAEWVGSGELLEDCRAEVIKRGISNVVFSGASINVADKLRNSDLLLMTSEWEGLPLAVLEAMSLGLGVILPDVGSCRDAVRNGHNGLLYSPNESPDRIAISIAEAINCGALPDWGQASRLRYLDSFTIERMTDEIEKVYKVAAEDLG